MTLICVFIIWCRPARHEEGQLLCVNKINATVNERYTFIVPDKHEMNLMTDVAISQGFTWWTLT